MRVAMPALRHAPSGSRLFTMLRFPRPHAGLLAAMYTVIGSYLASADWPDRESNVIRAAVTIALIVAFGFIINDYHDVDLDRMSKPYRAIPSGVVSERFAVLLAWVAAGLAVGVAASADLRAAAAALVLVICSAVYTLYLKPTLFLGIGMVAVLNAGAVLYGCIAVDALSPAALMLVVFAFLNAGAQETVYNLEDRVGDAASSVPTTAVRLGTEATLGLFSLLALACAAVTLAPPAIHIGSKAYIWTVLPCTTLPLVGIVVYVWMERTQESYGRAHRVMKLLRLSSILPVLLLH